MNIAIIGYGKMGKTVERIAKKRNHVIKICVDNTPPEYILKNIDVAIEFSHPNSVINNIKVCLKKHIPVVCGTTGWFNKLDYVKTICQEKKGSFLYASNFSIGMNIFYKMNQYLSKLLHPYANDYQVTIEEIHHKDKVDKPSGTAISLANDIIKNNVKKKWELDCQEKKEESISIISRRMGKEIGTHSIKYESEIDDIQISHKANNRDGFALGSVIAAEWIQNKKGFFSMQDVLN
ncbi:4-hydroxy-tetrahydrodipicolinate reductase [Blattabacterium cuenoti]|uniref:4-hydroxy-tetrahydrodipicolinate reductase n=1 Tax=Blattabacterium cuenoti TaxID=1653831 RepID=UPI00163C2C8C|nr:4-hydroxy-tetrahydrodipicolinate reductase [Blattabacterium cuenoti]